MQAASLLDGLSFDGFPPFKYGRCSAEVDVSRRQVVQALVVSTVVVVLNELADCCVRAVSRQLSASNYGKTKDAPPPLLVCGLY
jgi:hypothetical protein